MGRSEIILIFVTTIAHFPMAESFPINPFSCRHDAYRSEYKDCTQPSVLSGSFGINPAMFESFARAAEIEVCSATAFYHVCHRRQGLSDYTCSTCKIWLLSWLKAGPSKNYQEPTKDMQNSHVPKSSLNCGVTLLLFHVLDTEFIPNNTKVSCGCRTEMSTLRKLLTTHGKCFEVEYHDAVQLIRLQGRQIQILKTRGQSTDGKMFILAQKSNVYLYESRVSHIETDVSNTTYLHLTILLPFCAVSESGHQTKHGHNSRNSTMPEFLKSCTCRMKMINRSVTTVKISDNSDFHSVYLRWCKNTSFLNDRRKLLRNKHATNGTVSSLTNLMLCKIVIFVLVIITLLYFCLLQRKIVRNYDSNTTYLRILTSYFFFELYWTRSDSFMRTKWHMNLLTNWKGAARQTDEKPLLKQNSVFNTLNDYIFRPWLLTAHTGSKKSFPKASKFNSLSCFNSNDFLTHNRFIVQVFPVTGFLPDAMGNPNIDLAYVGYRLATLSALPPTMPVSRIKLADAGFYFRGQDDEVTCYSCHLRHSGWAREDNPSEIHRRLSPNCEYMQQRDRELSASVSQNSGGAAVRSGLDSAVNVSETEPNSYVEDSEGSHSTRSQQHVTALAEASPTQRPETGSASSAAVRCISASGTAVVNGSGSPGNTANPNAGHTGTASSTRSAPSVDNRADTTPHSISAATPSSAISTSQTRTFTSISTVSDASSGRTGPSASSRTSSSSTSRADARPLFPRPALDLGLAVYPMYQDMASRRRSFNRWDESQAPPLEQVLLSGMFYAGYADCVRCFYCGVGLKHWVVTDDVWTEHVRWRPACGYLKAIKGDDFIRNTQRTLGIEPSSDNQPGSTDRDRHSHQAIRNSSSAQSAAGQGQQSHSSSSVSTNTNTANTSTPAATTASNLANQASLAPSPSQRSTTSASTATTTTSSGATVTTTPSGASGNDHGAAAGGEEGASVTVVSSAAEDSERLTRLQAENRALTQRFQCKVCHNAAIDTILMPCGHLVVCETCARSVTSCPLCQDTIRATARVHMA